MSTGGASGGQGDGQGAGVGAGGNEKSWGSWWEDRKQLK